MTRIRKIRIPDLGGAEKVLVVEVLVSTGDHIAVDDGLVTLESDKASMDVPSPVAGVVHGVHVSVGSEVNENDLIVTLEVAESKGDTESEEVDRLEEPTESGLRVDNSASESGNSKETASAAKPAASPGPAIPPIPAALQGDGLRCDLLVLGAGPGGYTAAFRAADLGMKVVLVERYGSLGGVCLNVGCIPSKALLHVARVMDEASSLAAHGVEFGKPKIDLEKVRGFKSAVVGRLAKGLSSLAKQRDVQVVRGTGQFDTPHTLSVALAEGAVTVAFDQAIIAAGSSVVRLSGIPWDDPRIMDSTSALELPEIPRRLLLIGGGIIGLEMAMIYGALGSQLTVVEMMDGLMPGCDRDLVRPLQRRLQRDFKAKIHLETKVEELKALKKGLKVSFGGESASAPEIFDRVLVAVGRRPNSDQIGAEAAGIQVDEHGFIAVDKQQRTNVPHVFAIGDITGQPMLAHKASHEGKVAAEVAAGRKTAFVARVIPTVAYTDPEIAWVGLTETDAAVEGIDYEKTSFPWSASGRALGMDRSDGLTKILFDPGTRKVLGAGIVGPGAGDLIAELALAIEMDCEAADLALTVHPHPTLSETIALAAEAFEGTITDLYLPERS